MVAAADMYNLKYDDAIHIYSHDDKDEANEGKEDVGCRETQIMRSTMNQRPTQNRCSRTTHIYNDNGGPCSLW